MREPEPGLTPSARWATADAVREENSLLDGVLLELIGRVRETELAVGPDGEWTLAENLAHIAEFPGYFAQQLQAWLDGRIVVVGRVAEHDPSRNDAIVRAASARLANLTESVMSGFNALARALEGVTDAHLTQLMHNVKYGSEPLTAYLDRYVVGHKAAHVEQLRTAIAAAELHRSRQARGDG